LILPAQPPLPTAWNLPFQFRGSSASISICESADGASTSATRQCEGSDSAAVIVAFSSGTDASRSHGICAVAALTANSHNAGPHRAISGSGVTPAACISFSSASTVTGDGL
jgi:hypothetical protein